VKQKRQKIEQAEYLVLMLLPVPEIMLHPNGKEYPDFVVKNP
jgi:hypothetical protein